MFDAIKALFRKAGPKSLGVDKAGVAIDEPLLIAVMVIFIEVCSADQNIDEEETLQLVSVLESYYGIPEELTVKYVEQAIAERQKAGSLDSFVKIINDSYNDLQRELLLSLVWRMVLADDKVEDKERKLVVQMRYRFKLSEGAAERAREKAGG
jgi:uncharacterized tellurite resistance protein B-like protein